MNIQDLLSQIQFINLESKSTGTNPDNYIQNLQVPQPQVPEVKDEKINNPYTQVYGKYAPTVALGQLFAPLITSALGGLLSKGTGLPVATGLSMGAIAGLQGSEAVKKTINDKIKQLLAEQQIEAKLQAEALKQQREWAKMLADLEMARQKLEEQKRHNLAIEEARQKALEIQGQKGAVASQYKYAQAQDKTKYNYGRLAKYWFDRASTIANAIARLQNNQNPMANPIMASALKEVLKEKGMSDLPADKNEAIRVLESLKDEAYNNYRFYAEQSGIPIEEQPVQNTAPTSPPPTIDDLLGG